MEANHQMQIHKQEEKLKNDQGKSHGVQQAHLTNPSSSPPSSSSSPSHEFSFTISLHPSSASKSKSTTTTTPPHFAAIDLSPADEIFFHGHLLPLHLLSHFHIPPRTSANSLDSFTLPIKELSENNNNNNNDNDETDDQYINIDDTDHHPSISQESTLLQRKLGQKSKSFSLFGRPRWRKTREKAYEYDQDQGPKRNKPKFDVSNVLKRYMRLIKPFISLRNYRRDDDNNNNDDDEDDDDSTQKLPFSYSRNLKVRSKKGLRGRRGELFSAPASMSTSPTNSGLLVASGSVTPTSASDSTMEELQAAIQAAIAHCKKSIAAEDKNQAAVTT